MLSLSDLESVATAAARVDTNPVGLAGRMFGLSGAEQRAGIPGWAWLGVGAAVGIVGGLMLSRTAFWERISGRGSP